MISTNPVHINKLHRGIVDQAINTVILFNAFSYLPFVFNIKLKVNFSLSRQEG